MAAQEMAMKISDQGLELLIEREGRRNDAYLDIVGVWTIGVGHTGPEVHEGLHWTDAQVEAALRADLDRFEDAINDSVTVGLEPYQFDALVSFSFNVGVGAFKTSTLLRKINLGQIELAELQFNRWHTPPEITRRRNGEREQFAGRHFVAQYP
jgi:lysozyme